MFYGFLVVLIGCVLFGWFVGWFVCLLFGSGRLLVLSLWFEVCAWWFLFLRWVVCCELVFVLGLLALVIWCFGLLFVCGFDWRFGFIVGGFCEFSSFVIWVARWLLVWFSGLIYGCCWVVLVYGWWVSWACGLWLVLCLVCW